MKNYTTNDSGSGNNEPGIVRQYYTDPLKKGAKSVIPRASEVPIHFRDENEVAAAATMGRKPHEVNSLYKDVYEFYQNNEY